MQRLICCLACLHLFITTTVNLVHPKALPGLGRTIHFARSLRHHQAITH